MTTKDKILYRFNRLIEEGKHFSQKRYSGVRVYKWYSYSNLDMDYLKWIAEVLDIIRNVYGKQSEFYSQLLKMRDDSKSKNSHSAFYFCFNILKSAKTDFENDVCGKSEYMSARVDVCSEFLNQAKALSEKESCELSFFLCVSVIENTLKKLCHIHKIHYLESFSGNMLNELLFKAEVYGLKTFESLSAKFLLQQLAKTDAPGIITKENGLDAITWTEAFLNDTLFERETESVNK